MTTRCKFRCNEVTKRSFKDGFEYTAKFSAVYSGSEDNKEFFKYTPSGSLDIGVYKEDLFQPGKEYYIDITEAE